MVAFLVSAANRKRLTRAQFGMLTKSPTAWRTALYFFMVAQRDCGTGALPSQGVDDLVDFGPYLRSLPVSYEDPLWWPAHELEFLAGTNLYLAVKKRREALASAHAMVAAALGGVEDGTSVEPGKAKGEGEEEENHTLDSALAGALRLITLKDVIWAHSAYTSRCFPHKLCLPVSPHASSTSSSLSSSSSSSSWGCLLPFLDLMNHAYKTPISWVRDETGLLSFVSGSEGGGKEMAPSSSSSSSSSSLSSSSVACEAVLFKAGSEVFNNYGPKGNEE